jgi:predicted nucleic acid-binding Zn ribbon protein
MLCYHDINNGHGDICTNRCEEWANCERRKAPSHMKIPFLVESLDRFVSETNPEIYDGIPVMRFHQYAISPQATENGFLGEISPTNDKPSFYSDMKNHAA